MLHSTVLSQYLWCDALFDVFTCYSIPSSFTILQLEKICIYIKTQNSILEFVFVFGTTAPSGSWPPHSRDF